MTRISRFKTPRASLAALALLAAYVFTFYMVDALGHGDAALAKNAPPVEALDVLPSTMGATAEPEDAAVKRRLLPCERRAHQRPHTEEQR